MSDAKFEKVSRSDQPLYGPRKLLLCGFPVNAQPKFKAVLKMAGLSEVPLLWVTDAQADQIIGRLLDFPHDTGAGEASSLPRAIVVSGITQAQLHRLMTVCRKTGMRQALWAALTPTSETWTLKALMAELAAERKAMSKKRR